MSGDIDIHHLAAAYALDALDERERAAFEAHYPACEVCHADVLGFRDTLAALSAVSATPAPAGVKDRVMAEIATTRQLSPRVTGSVADLAERRRRRTRTLGGLFAVAAAAAAAFVVGGVVVGRDHRPAYAEALTEVMHHPDARMLTLTAHGTLGTVRVAWTDDGERAVLLGDGIPEVPAGSAYELWLITGGTPQPMRVLQPSANGELRAVVDLTAPPDAWGVTIEPERGSPAPTGAEVFTGEV